MEVNIEILEKVNEIVREYYDIAENYNSEENIIERICSHFSYDLDDALYSQYMTTPSEMIKDVISNIEELKDKTPDEQYNYFVPILEDTSDLISWLKEYNLYNNLIEYYTDEDQSYEDINYEMIDELENAFYGYDNIQIGSGSYKIAIIDTKEKSVIKFDNIQTYMYGDNGIDWEYRVYNDYKSNNLDFLLAKLIPISNLIENPVTHYYLQPMVQSGEEQWYNKYTDKDIKRIVNKRSSKLYNATSRYFNDEHFFHALMDSYGFKVVLDYVTKIKENKVPALGDIYGANVSYVNGKIIVIDYGITQYYN